MMCLEEGAYFMCAANFRGLRCRFTHFNQREGTSMPTLMRNRTLPVVDSLRREMNDAFSRFFPSLFEDGQEGKTSVMWNPRMDLSETDEAFLVQMDLPGLKKDEITVNVADHQLTVSGERKEEKKEEKENFLRVERSSGSFFRSLTLPSAVNEDAIQAEFKDGVLTITIPKTEESKSRRIEVS